MEESRDSSTLLKAQHPGLRGIVQPSQGPGSKGRPSRPLTPPRSVENAENGEIGLRAGWLVGWPGGYNTL